MKRFSRIELAGRRAQVVHAVRETVQAAGTDLEFVNGGGTGSLESTCAEECVTEVASGAPGKDRLPAVAWPQGLHYSGAEGAGEVQTPLTGDPAADLQLGDTVFLRHAKAGEPAEHVQRTLVYSQGRITDVWPTYRGEGQAFL